MISIRDVLDKCAAQKRAALIGYIPVGFPSPIETCQILETMVTSGCDIIELGVPFSDPVADGPIIQKASYNALQAGVTLDTCFETALWIRKMYEQIPIVLMGYSNPFWRRGLQMVGTNCKECGIESLIIPDLPVEHSGEWRELLSKFDVSIIPFLSPTTIPSRLKPIADLNPPFIYCISQPGTTGNSLSTIPAKAIEHAELFRKVYNIPCAIGFGISQPDQITQCKRYFDGVIVGSAIIKSYCDSSDGVNGIKNLLTILKKATYQNETTAYTHQFAF